MTVRYRSRRPNDTELRARLRALAHERRRFGYRRLLVLLRREGLKRLFRLYRDGGLAGPSARAGASDPWERAPG
jgi:transposase InsO family protein